MTLLGGPKVRAASSRPGARHDAQLLPANGFSEDPAAASPCQGRARTTTLVGKLSVPKPVNLPSIKKVRCKRARQRGLGLRHTPGVADAR